jgi:hypothetical protein
MRKGGQGRGGNNFLPSISAPPPKNLPSPSDLFDQQMGIPASARRAKCPWVDADGASGPSPRSGLTLVCSVLPGRFPCLRRNLDLLTCSLEGSLVFAVYRGQCICNYGVILVRQQRRGASIQEGSSLVLPTIIFSVRTWC